MPAATIFSPSTVATHWGTGFKRAKAPCLSRRAPTVRRHIATRAEQNTGEKESWDLGRFFRTVLYFNPPPSVGKVLESLRPDNLLRSLAPKVEVENTSRPGREWVLVAGAAGDVGRHIVEKLLQRGRKVRALDSDPARLHAALDALPRAAHAELDTAAADVTQPATLRADLFYGVDAIIAASGESAAGDDRGILNLLQAARGTLAGPQPLVIFDPASEVSQVQWGPLDDVVMGGVSESRIDIRQGAREDGGPAAVFSGRVSSANNGGFASVRTRNFEPALNLGGYEALQLRVKGDGQRYKVTVRTDSGWDSVGYTKSFDTRADEWQDVRLPFEEFVPVFRAKTVPMGPKLDGSHICSIQLMLSKFEYDGVLNPSFRLGGFSLPIATISAVPAESQTPRFVYVSPSKAAEEEHETDAERALRDSGVPFAVARLEVSPPEHEPRVSSADIAELAIELLRKPTH